LEITIGRIFVICQVKKLTIEVIII
jgi:hypothetical protein